MQQRRWYGFTLTWSLSILLAGGATALVCMSDDTAHEVTHALMCIDPSNPVAGSDHSPTPVEEGRKGRLPSHLLTCRVHPAAISIHPPLTLGLPSDKLAQMQTTIASSTPASLRPVLRL